MSCCEVLCCVCAPTGRDCLGCAKTGSGKTAAFALPILHRLAEDPYGIFALVLTPTRLGGLVLHVDSACASVTVHVEGRLCISTTRHLLVLMVM